MRRLKSLLITGGSGFIGSNFINWLFKQSGFDGLVVNLDALTYAGNQDNLALIEEKFGGTRYFFVKGNICDRVLVEKIYDDYATDTVIHFAAESHVDRSILGPEEFIRTNIFGTYVLLDIARKKWEKRTDTLFHHVSTDEVYGSLGGSGYFVESTPYAPRSPYSASKAGSDHLVKSYHHTYGVPITASNCSNNYGPFQFPEKLIPLMILNMLDRKPLPVYGDGRNIRDWLYVEDHNAAIWAIVNGGRLGETYNIGGENEWENIELLKYLIKLVAEESRTDSDTLESLITYVKDRPGHDRRYAIDCSKLKSELGWKQIFSFDEGLRKTVRWYIDNQQWCDRVRSGEYKVWVEKNYSQRS